MNQEQSTITPVPSTPSDLARARFLASEGEARFVCEWPRVLFVHYEVEREVLQRQVPFELEPFEEKAVVSLVAFTMRGFRPRWGGRLTAWLAWPVATNHFFNVRTYVRHRGESGVFFMRQWLSHPLCLTARLPGLRLPWDWGRMLYEHRHEVGRLEGHVLAARTARLSYSASIEPGAEFAPSSPESLAQFCLERYTAFAHRGRKAVVLRIWHQPWPQCPVQVALEDGRLLAQTGEWLQHARFLGANYSVGLREVWMGAVRALKESADSGKPRWTYGEQESKCT